MLDSLTKNANTYYFDNDPTTGQPQAFHQPNTQADYLVTDGQGSVVAIVSGDAGGTLIGTYTYDPYGTQTDQTGTAFGMTINPYRHTSGLLDPATGWVRHGTRYNDTTTGRWTTTDPITRLADPDNANPYTYAADDPINNTDPSGKGIWDAISEFAGYLQTCYETGAAAATPAFVLGFIGGPETAVLSGAGGFLYGCGAGVIVQGTTGFTITP